MTTRVPKLDEPAVQPQTKNSSVASGEAPDKLTIRRPVRSQLSAEETRMRMESFEKEREEAFVAAIRE